MTVDNYSSCPDLKLKNYSFKWWHVSSSLALQDDCDTIWSAKYMTKICKNLSLWIQQTHSVECIAVVSFLKQSLLQLTKQQKTSCHMQIRTETETSSPHTWEHPPLTPKQAQQHVRKSSNLPPSVPHLTLARTQKRSPHDLRASARYTLPQPNMLIIRVLLLEGVITTINTLMCAWTHVCVEALWWCWVARTCVCVSVCVHSINSATEAQRTPSQKHTQREFDVTIKQFPIPWSSCEFWHKGSRNRWSDRFWLISSGEQRKEEEEEKRRRRGGSERCMEGEKEEGGKLKLYGTENGFLKLLF